MTHRWKVLIRIFGAPRRGLWMQDGFIFSETIAQNIAVGEEQVDLERLRHAVMVANIRDFIDSLPLGYNTKIGAWRGMVSAKDNGSVF